MKNTLNQPIVVNITLATIFKAFFGIFLVYLLYILRDLILVLMTSIIIASAFEPLIRWLTAKKIPRAISVIFVYFMSVSLFVGIFVSFIVPLVTEVKNLVQTIPQYVVSISESNQLTTLPAWNNFVDEIQNFEESQIFAVISGNAGGTTLGLLSTASTIFGGIFSMILIIVLSFYFSVQENGVENFIRIITPIKNEKYILGLWKRSQRKIGLWMQGQLLLAVIIGVLTYLSLTILGIQNALLLALIAAVFELIPIFGPLLAAVPAVIFGLLQGGVTMGLIIVGVYIIIQQFESQLIHPLVVKKIVGIPALIAIMSLIIGAQIAGFLGVLISVPVAGAIMEYISDVEKKKALEMKELGA